MRFGFAAAAMALLSSVRGFFGGASLPIVSIPQTHRRSGGSKRIRLGGSTYKPNGAREVARRQRQIAEGRLTVSNGVV
ncbi:hypothetical protein Q5698_08360 [Brucella intermedia]|uniref:hypothetical protein n=1 Tax=Brucella intermedia TaxID=94625 RepID=UPI002733E325|nr:hypothetical protein [Brucella intermedia]WLF95683.1 hypothetical protein Q5698_08360 [Brucella intermedia]